MPASRQHHLTKGLPYDQASHQKGTHRPDAQWGTIMDCLAIKKALPGMAGKQKLPYRVSAVGVCIPQK